MASGLWLNPKWERPKDACKTLRSQFVPKWGAAANRRRPVVVAVVVVVIMVGRRGCGVLQKRGAPYEL